MPDDSGGDRGRIARVVPSIPSFSVDTGFRYAIPERLVDVVSIGSMVRVPLAGRRIGGFVVAVEDGDRAALKPIAAMSGKAPVFDNVMLEVLRWAANHYVAPLSVMLGRAAPPNVPPGPGTDHLDPIPDVGHHSPGAVAGGPGGGRTVVVLEGGDPSRWVAPLAASAAHRGKSTLVVVPTAQEAEQLATSLEVFGDRVVLVGGEMDDGEVTAAWGRSAHLGGVVVGTPRVAAWPVAELGVLVVVEDSRRAMKDRQTPTVHVRELLRTRALATHATLVCGGPTPSLEVMSRAPRVIEPAGRIWPLVEVVDRRDDPPGSGLLSERVKHALRATTGAGGTAFLFAHRRGYSAASRCVACRELRRCAGCGSRPDPGETCRRCGAALGPCPRCRGGRFEPLGAGVGRLVEETGRVLGRGRVVEHPGRTPVTVGTERDLAGLDLRDLVVLVDADGLVYGVDYRAGEEALRVGARLASRLRAGTGRRLMVQTHDPGHPVIVALRRGDPRPFIEHELGVRAALGYPPAGELIVVEVRGAAIPAEVHSDLAAAAGRAMVLGPAEGGAGTRWLVQAPDLTRFRAAMRPVLQRWRDAGLTVRVDVDPIDL